MNTEPGRLLTWLSGIFIGAERNNPECSCATNGEVSTWTEPQTNNSRAVPGVWHLRAGRYDGLYFDAE